MLLEQRGNVLTRDEIRQELWPSDSAGDFENGINIAVSKLRRALGDSSTEPRFVQTVPRQGYRFLVSTEVIQSLPRSVAVLPLFNRSGDPEQEFFSDGLTDELISSLAKIGSIKVISSTSSSQYKGSQKALSQIARELSVEAIVEGSVRRAGDRVRISVRLVAAATDGHLWAETYDRQLTDILLMHCDIARAVAREIRARLTEPEIDRLTAVSRVHAGAYEVYLRGTSQLHRFTPDGIGMALKHYRLALDIDPNSALARAGIAFVAMYSTTMGMMHPREAASRGLPSAYRAVELDPGFSDGFVALALLQQYSQWDWHASERSYLRAIDLSPNNATAYLFYSLLLTHLKRLDEADRNIRKALDLNPLDLFFQHIFGMQRFFTKLHEESVEILRGVVARAPKMQMAHMVLWCALHCLGRECEAVDAATEAWASVDDEAMVNALRSGYSGGGYCAAMKGAAETLASRFESSYVLPHLIAYMYNFAGDSESALKWIEIGYREREHAMAHLSTDPHSQQLRRNPRLQQILAELRLPA